jgi:DNA replication protein DnaC
MGYSFLYECSNVPPRYKDFRPMYDNQSESWGNAYESFKNSLKGGNTYVVHGPRGTGKTQFAASCCGYYAFKLKEKPYYITSHEMFLDIRTSQSEVETFKLYTDFDFLVIDQFESRSDSDYENRTLDQIIDKRYALLKTTMIITNEKEDSLAATLGKNIIRRMMQDGERIALNDTELLKRSTDYQF